MSIDEDYFVRNSKEFFHKLRYEKDEIEWALADKIAEYLVYEKEYTFPQDCLKPVEKDKLKYLVKDLNLEDEIDSYFQTLRGKINFKMSIYYFEKEIKDFD